MAVSRVCFVTVFFECRRCCGMFAKLVLVAEFNPLCCKILLKAIESPTRKCHRRSFETFTFNRFWLDAPSPLNEWWWISIGSADMNNLLFSGDRRHIDQLNVKKQLQQNGDKYSIVLAHQHVLDPLSLCRYLFLLSCCVVPLRTVPLSTSFLTHTLIPVIHTTQLASSVDRFHSIHC